MRRRIVVAGGISLVILLTPALLISLFDCVPTRVLGFIVWEAPGMLVYFVGVDEAPGWMLVALAWALWGLITYAVLWVVDVHVRSSSSERA